MPKVKIKHGLAFYLDESGENPVQLTAFRTQVINVSEKEATRLKELGAAIDAEAELPLVGRLTPLPNTASDEELLAWCSVASRDEIAQAVEDRPELGDRILAARDIVRERMEAQQELLSGIEDHVKEAQAAGKKRAKAGSRQSAPTSGQAGPHQTRSQAGAVDDDDEDLIGDDGDEEEEELEEEGDGDELHDNLDEVVKGNVEAVSKYLSENPDQAQAILEAEDRRAAAAREAGDQQRARVRDGVVQAAQAAAAHFAAQ